MLYELLPQNYHRYLDYLPLFLISVGVSFVLTPFIGYIARKLDIVAKPPSKRKGDKPSDYRHLEKPTTPLLGGVAVLASLIALILIHTQMSVTLIYFLIAIAVILLGGVLDDALEVDSKTQFLFQITAALLIVLSPLNLNFINDPFNGIWNLNWLEFAPDLGSIVIDIVFPGDIILFGWIIICINAVKWVSGTDGLMEGNSIFASLTLFILSLRFEKFQAATISIIFGGLILGFLFYNFYPARIRSGSAGKTAYGFILSVLSLMSGAKIAIGIIIFMIPLMDFLWVIVGRIKQHKPKSIGSLMAISDQTHLHHRLLKLGLNEPQIALLEYFLSAVFGAVALMISGAMNAFIWLASAITFSLVLWFISNLLKKGKKIIKKDNEETPESKYSY
jgi:UDP-GlcNAc:undecaprenyl-phosphate GlcNAc-1-phosphate transferase